MEQEAKKNIVNTERYHYQKTVIDDGRRKIYSKDNGDALAVAMRGMTNDELRAVIAENNLDQKYLGYADTKTLGHFRMILGQHLRYKWRRGEMVKVRGEALPPFAPVAQAQAA